jgi:predicted nucleotidyltransferase
VWLQVQDAVRELFPNAWTVLFGSQANGMALHNSDLDIVILNAVPNLIIRWAFEMPIGAGRASVSVLLDLALALSISLSSVIIAFF